MSFVRVVCVAYWVLLSVLLLTPDPLGMLGIPRPPGPPGGRIFHFLLFTLLALAVHASRWRIRPRLLAGLLVGYALATETLQAFIPNRKVELLDLIENLLGVGMGTVIWWFVQAKILSNRNAQCPDNRFDLD